MRGQQGGLGQDAPARALAARVAGVLGQLAVQPLLLCPAQEAARRIRQGRTLRRAHAALVRLALGAARLGAAVLAAVQQMQPGQPAPLQAAVQLQSAAAMRCPGARQRAGAQRHVFVEGLPGGHATGQETRGIALALVARVVVLHLMVVPAHGPVAQGVRGLQQRVALVQGVAVAVVLQGLRGAQVVRAGQAQRHGGRGVFVDVVAQEDHQVRRVLHHLAPGRVVAMLPALAGGIGQTQALRQAAGGGRRAAAARAADRLPQHEAVVVPAVRRQSTYLHMHAVAPFGLGHGLAAAHDVAEKRVVGQLPADAQRGHGRGVGLAQLGQRRRQPRPQQHVVGLGVAAGHAQREGVVRRTFAQPGPGRQLAQRRGQARADQKLAPRCWDGGAEGQEHGGSGQVAQKSGERRGLALGGSKAGACISNRLPLCA